MPIRILSEEIVSQIAAGEVVERPSSVVKELVENSIDAGARAIQVETRGGGKRFIRVTDDGCGIPSAEVELAFHRHSTSKLASASDLGRIATLGFRGEALASIAAVSRVTVATRAADETTGTLLRLEGGKVLFRQASGRPPGTAVTVEDLFFNTPARLKFLRTDQTERRHIDGWLTRYALAYPNLRFTLNHDGQTVFQSPGNGRMRDALVAVYGLEVGAELIEIAAAETNSIRVSGFVSPPSLHRANRAYITLFVNGRWVQDSHLTYAIVQAYHALLPAGRYPVAVVMVYLPPEEIDVNVHPAKAEVRFRDSDAVFQAVQKAVRRTLVEAPIPSAVSWAQETSAWAREERLERLARLTSPSASKQLRFEAKAEMASGLGASALKPAADQLPPLRVIGQLSATYILAEGPEGLYLIDQHAAHERVLFERLMAERERSEATSQALLEPKPVELAPEAASLLEEHRDALQRLGFQIEAFGRSALLVRALPTIVAQENPREVLEDVAAALLLGDAPLTGRVEEAIARSVCKRAAVKAGRTMTQAEMERLLRALEECANPRTCPHGRPTMIHLSAAYLAREFNRV